jgi:hypothetical protein
MNYVQLHILVMFKDTVKSGLRIGSAHNKGGPTYILLINKRWGAIFSVREPPREQ